MKWIEVDAPRLLARSDSKCRPLATRIGVGWLDPDGLKHSAHDAVRLASDRAGRVASSGRFVQESSRIRLVEWLGPALGTRLLPEFEWYLCRGAFFHNDAHYADVLFGVWYIEGPSMDLVFPRAATRLSIVPGDVIVFDPFEIHGVLLPGESQWDAERHASCEPSAFAGFEIALDATVETIAGMQVAGEAGTLSSGTRVSATTGEIVRQY